MSADRILHIPMGTEIEAVPMYHQYGVHPEDGSPIIGDRSEP